MGLGHYEYHRLAVDGLAMQPTFAVERQSLKDAEINAAVTERIGLPHWIEFGQRESDVCEMQAEEPEHICQDAGVRRGFNKTNT